MYNNLRAEMTRAAITSSDIAKSLKINRSTLSAKLNKRGRLKYHEAVKIRDAFFPSFDIDYLFYDASITNSRPCKAQAAEEKLQS